MTGRWGVVAGVLWGLFAGELSLVAADQPQPMVVNLRRRVEVAPETGRYHTLTTPTTWDPARTAIVICDMWDKHWCPTATERVAEMAPRMNDVVTAARRRGVLIIHCPSDTMEFYKDAPQRKRAQQAPAVETRRPLERWCRIDPTHEAPLPIDDTDGGCDCGEPVKNYRAWSRQIADIVIHEDDAITDSDEAYRLMKSRGVENVIVMGVHTNMCVLGRPFSIRQMVYQGLNVALMRDMTDTMYNPAMKPFVSHFTGNDLVVEHIEKYWCPSLTSSDFLGGKPFRFTRDQRPHLVILSAEDEYRTEVTLPEFAATHLGRDFRVSFVFESASKKNDLPGIEVINDADVLLISVRRRPLPADQLALVRKFVAAGKPVVGIRTASHAFHLRETQPEGLAAWPEIDRELIGGNYQGHTAGSTHGIIRPLPDVKHPILTGIPAGEFPSGGTLYLNTPLDPDATELMRGRIEGNARQEPVAWTFKRRDGGRTFYTSLGHRDDFQQPAFRRLLLNGLLWAAGIEIPSADSKISSGAPSWKTLKVPGTWEEHPDLKSHDGFGWYHCQIRIPETWRGRSGYLYVEKVDNACESFVNGVKVGVSGSLPPRYVNGVENQHRYAIPPELIRPGAINSVSLRIFDEGGAGGFKGAAPSLIGGADAIPLAGTWIFRAGDSSLTTAEADSAFAAEQLAPFERLEAAPKVSPFATVIRREVQQTALSPAESLQRFKIPEDLQVDLVLSEPLVTQPLFMNFDERGRLWVMQYRQYPEPAGLKLISKDQWWRAVYDKVPAPPPQGVKGADRISIHEDTDGDGVYDTHKVFIDDLNIATAFVQGRGGVWVLNPPYLLYYPDRNGDDIPDAAPEVHLEGFGLEDTHSVVNSLRWGPDGWLYAAQGSTVSAAVKVRSSDAMAKTPVQHSQGQNIWRYHPESRRFEIFSEGGGNAFGVEIDAAGRVFSGHNGGNTRGFHYMQGAYLQKGFSKHGPLSNPFSFGYFPAMEHHNVPRFTHEFVIYEGRGGALALPDRYFGKLFGAAAILNHVVISDVERTGSTFRTKDIGYAIDSTDTWFRPVDVKDGPDGALYVADWYDGQLAHTANYQGGLDRDHGRIYRIRGRGTPTPGRQPDLRKSTSAELIQLLASPDRWHREAARRLLADRRDPSVIASLRQSLPTTRGQLALELLWALHLSGGLDEPTARALVDHDEPQVRLWTVRLLGDDRRLPSDVATRVTVRSLTEPDIEVRAQYAATAKRIPADQALPILRNLMQRDEDLQDPRQPLLVWWALEATSRPAADGGAGSAGPMTLFQDPDIWKRPLVQREILPRLMRRYASTGQRSDLATCAQLLKLSPTSETTQSLMRGFEEAYQGRSLSNLPAELIAALSMAGGGSLALKVRQGQANAIDDALAAVANEKESASRRQELVGVLGEVRQPRAVDVFLKTLSSTSDDALKAALLNALQSFSEDRIAESVIQQYGNWNEEVRSVAQSLLVSRKAWAKALLAAVDRAEIPPAGLPVETVRRMTIYKDPTMSEQIARHWGTVEGATTAQMQELIERLSARLDGSGDPYPGKKLFLQMCGKCHTLHAQGGKIGPDLTTYKRDDVRQMLLHIVNPSAEIREGYETQVAILEDGRVITGFLVDQDAQSITLRSPDGQSIAVDRSDIDELNKSRISLMPEGQLKDLSDEQVRNLFAYLRSSQPLND